MVLLVFIFFFVDSNAQKKINNLSLSLTPCSPNTFWVCSTSNFNNYAIYQCNLSSGSITLSGSVTGCIGGGLGIINNLNGGTINPTFYSELADTLPYYFDSTSWHSCNIVDTLFLRNCGGFGNNIYYSGLKAGSIGVQYIVRYDGISLTIIYQFSPNTYMGVADLAVDENSNLWFFTLNDSLPFFADSLNVIDSAGNLLFQYDTNFDVTNAYGMCIINDSIYLGFGAQNISYPNMLVSVSLIGNTAAPNNSISIPTIATFPTFTDLASCNPGVPTGFKEVKKPNQANITLYPNPATNKITVGNIPPHAQALYIINSMGAMVWRQRVNEQAEVEVSTLHLAPGIYAVSVMTKEDVWVKKMVKQ